MYRFASLLAIISLSQAISINQTDNGGDQSGNGSSQRKGKGGHLGQAFAGLDLDESGTLSRDELETFFTGKGVDQVMTDAWLDAYDMAEDDFEKRDFCRFFKKSLDSSSDKNISLDEI